MSRQARNAHAGDGYKVYCKQCRHNHTLCPPYEEGCDYPRKEILVRSGVRAWMSYGWRVQQWHRHLLAIRDGYKCYACGWVPLDYRERKLQEVSDLDNRLEVQHIMPASMGGSNCLHNLVLLCHKCHVKTFENGTYGGYGGIPKR